MRVDVQEALHGFGAEALRQGVDEARQIRHRAVPCLEVALAGVARPGLFGEQADEVDAAVCLDALRQRVEARAKQRCDAFGVGERLAGADARIAHRPVGVEQLDREPPRALAAHVERIRQALGELCHARRHPFDLDQRLGEAALHHERRERGEGGDRLALAPLDLVDAPGHRGAETLHQRRPRLAQELGDGLQPEPHQDGDGLLRQAQRLDGQRRDGGKTLAVGDDGRAIVRGVARHSPCDGGALGDRDVRPKSPCGEAGDDVGGHLRLAAEKVGAAGDVEEEAARRIEADERRVAVGSAREREQRRRVRVRVGRLDA